MKYLCFAFIEVLSGKWGDRVTQSTVQVPVGLIVKKGKSQGEEAYTTEII